MKDLKTFYPGAVLETGFDILFSGRTHGTWEPTMETHPSKTFTFMPGERLQGRKCLNHWATQSTRSTLFKASNWMSCWLKRLSLGLKNSPSSQGLEKVPDGIPSSEQMDATLASLSGQGRDIKLSIPRVAGYRAFLNKIWNATRFAMMRLPSGPIAPLSDMKAHLSLADRWILSELQKTITKANHGMTHYRFDEVADSIYQFFWSSFCDWYIELIKTSLSDDAPEQQKQAAASVLVHVLDESMRLLHPICPFQSEEIWQTLPGNQARWKAQGFAYCAQAPYPQADSRG